MTTINLIDTDNMLKYYFPYHTLEITNKKDAQGAVYCLAQLIDTIDKKVKLQCTGWNEIDVLTKINQLIGISKQLGVDI